MSSENQSNLRFSVEESVWFQKGQEVSNLVSISLDPDILIQEHDQYVSIRGALLLTGEYRIDENPNEEEGPDFTSVRLVNEVVPREDGINELKHRFPVDITIPKNRIQSLDDVYVTIESFDYELPQRGCLQIFADLTISGIQSVTTRKKVEENQEETPEEATPVVEVKAQEEVHAEVEEEKEEVLVRNSESEEVVEEEAVEEVVLQQEEEVVLHSEATEDEDEHDVDLFVPFEVEARKEAYQEQEVEVEVEVEEEADTPEVPEVAVVSSPQIEVKSRAEKFNVFNSFEKNKAGATAVEEREESPVNENKHPEKEEQKTKRNENELTLTKIFTKDEEEEHLKMKICIVQSGDTIDKISERYNIPVQQLVRVNSLNDDHVVEGQLLYIPTHSKN